MDYRRAIEKLYPGALADRDYRLEDDGTGIKVVNWGLGGIPPIVNDLNVFKVEVEAEELAEKQIEDKIENEIRSAAIKTLISKGDIPEGII